MIQINSSKQIVLGDTAIYTMFYSVSFLALLFTIFFVKETKG